MIGLQGAAEAAGLTSGMANMSVSQDAANAKPEAAGAAQMAAGIGVNRTASLFPGVVSGTRAMSLGMTYQQPGKKATTILSPHLETIDFGSMLIVLDEESTSFAIGQPLSGKIMLIVQEPTS